MTDRTTPNLPLLRRVRDAIAEEADAFDMGSWVQGPGGDADSPSRALGLLDRVYHAMAEEGHAPCGTSACLAGWAVSLTPYAVPAIRWAVRRAEEAGGRPPSMNLTIPVVALEALGLPDARLFHVASWPRSLQLLAEEVQAEELSGSTWCEHCGQEVEPSHEEESRAEREGQRRAALQLLDNLLGGCPYEDLWDADGDDLYSRSDSFTELAASLPASFRRDLGLPVEHREQEALS